MISFLESKSILQNLLGQVKQISKLPNNGTHLLFQQPLLTVSASTLFALKSRRSQPLLRGGNKIDRLARNQWQEKVSENLETGKKFSQSSKLGATRAMECLTIDFCQAQKETALLMLFMWRAYYTENTAL